MKYSSPTRLHELVKKKKRVELIIISLKERKRINAINLSKTFPQWANVCDEDPHGQYPTV